MIRVEQAVLVAPAVAISLAALPCSDRWKPAK